MSTYASFFNDPTAQTLMTSAMCDNNSKTKKPRSVRVREFSLNYYDPYVVNAKKALLSSSKSGNLQLDLLQGLIVSGTRKFKEKTNELFLK